MTSKSYDVIRADLKIRLEHYRQSAFVLQESDAVQSAIAEGIRMFEALRPEGANETVFAQLHAQYLALAKQAFGEGERGLERGHAFEELADLVSESARPQPKTAPPLPTLKLG